MESHMFFLVFVKQKPLWRAKISTMNTWELYVLPQIVCCDVLVATSHWIPFCRQQAGDPVFVKLALEFVYGEDSVPLQENRIGGVQTLSGTGGLRVMGELLRKHGHSVIHVPNPTWGNHNAIFTNSGLEVKKYSYYNVDNSDLDFDAMIKDIGDMPEGSCILLHACAHNPTG